jgi:hypothetical protein
MKKVQIQALPLEHFGTGVVFLHVFGLRKHFFGGESRLLPFLPPTAI